MELSSGVVPLATGLRFPEGPVALPNGDVLVTELAGGTIVRVAPDGTTSLVADCGGGPNGAAVGPDGALYVCNNGGFAWKAENRRLDAAGELPDFDGGSIQRVDISTGEVETLYSQCDRVNLARPNDLVFDDHGGFYFTDSGARRRRDRDYGYVYYATPDGRSIRQILGPMEHPNGIGLSPTGDRLYVAETFTGRVWAWGVIAAGALDVCSASVWAPSGGTVLCGLGGFRLLDSLAVDSAGSVCVGTIVNGAITSISAEGAIEGTLDFPDEDRITNIAFGGADLQTAFITGSSYGVLYRCDWHRPGLRLAF